MDFGNVRPPLIGWPFILKTVPGFKKKLHRERKENAQSYTEQKLENKALLTLSNG